MLTLDQQVEKLNKKKKALNARITSDTAEIEKINAKLNEIQLTKIRETLGINEKELWGILNHQPEQLLQLVGNDSVDADSNNADDADTEAFGHQMSFTEKKNPYED